MIYDTLKKTGLPVRYSHFDAKQKQAPPFLVYLGNGQEQEAADDTVYWKLDTFEVDYINKKKDPEMEELIESTLLADGFLYEKSEDVYIEDEGVFIIYYYVN